MLQILQYMATTFALTFVISFVILLFLFKVCIGTVMKFLGADVYTFNLKKRLKIISIISLVFAVLAVLAVLFG